MKTKLHQFMRLAGMTDRDVALEVDLDFTTVYRVRTGRVMPSGETARKLAAWSREVARAKRIPRLSVEDVLGV